MTRLRLSAISLDSDWAIFNTHIRSTAPRNTMETTFVEIESTEWVVAQRKDEVQGRGSHLCPDHGHNRQVKEHS